MDVIQRPPRVWFLILFLTLILPLGLAQSVLLSTHPWWAIPLRTVGVSVALWLAWVLILGGAIYRLRPWVKWGLPALGAFWMITLCYFAFERRSFSLGLLALVGLGYWVSLGIWIVAEWGRSYLTPNLKWYEGPPPPLPGLKCSLQGTVLRAHRLDEQGIFVFADPKASELFSTDKKIELSLGYGELSIQCQAVPIVRWERSSEVGIGLRFVAPTADARKELGDLLERLRVHGYV